MTRGRFQARVETFRGKASLALSFEVTPGKHFTWYFNYRDVSDILKVLKDVGQEFEQLHLELEAKRRRGE